MPTRSRLDRISVQPRAWFQNWGRQHHTSINTRPDGAHSSGRSGPSAYPDRTAEKTRPFAGVTKWRDLSHGFYMTPRRPAGFARPQVGRRAAQRVQMFLRTACPRAGQSGFETHKTICQECCLGSQSTANVDSITWRSSEETGNNIKIIMIILMARVAENPAACKLL